MLIKFWAVKTLQEIFLNHGGLHVQLLDIGFTKKNITSVLLACETPLIEAQRKEFNV